MQVGVSIWYPSNPSGLDAAAAALIGRMTTPPTAARAALINNLVVALKSAGAWDSLDALWLIAASDSQAASLNWKGAAFPLSPINSPTFTADRGYAGDGTASYVDTNFNPFSAGGKYVRDDATFGIWSRTGGGTTVSVAGWFGGSSGVNIRPRSTGNAYDGRINQAVSFAVANSNGAGFFAFERSGPAAAASYINGSVAMSDANASSAVNDNNLYLGRSTASSFTATQFAAAAVGSSLGPTKQAAFYNAINTYLTAVGAA